MNKIIVAIDTAHAGIKGLLVLPLATMASWFYRCLLVRAADQLIFAASASALFPPNVKTKPIMPAMIGILLVENVPIEYSFFIRLSLLSRTRMAETYDFLRLNQYLIESIL